MVTLNPTLLIELLLFLVFLWGTARFILRPVVRNLDERNETIERHYKNAKTQSHEAEALESRYTGELASSRARADDAFHDARRKALEDHKQFLHSERQRADEAIAQHRDEAARQVLEEKALLGPSVDEVAELIKARLGLKKSAS